MLFLQHVLVRSSIAGFYRRVFSSPLNRNAPEYSLYFDFLDEALNLKSFRCLFVHVIGISL